jgi:hypothetical protein
VLPYNSTIIMESIPFRRISDKHFRRSMVPEHIFDSTRQPIFTHKYSGSVRSMLDNTGVFIKKLSREKIQKLLASCPRTCCQSSPFYDRDHGHTCTTLSAISGDAQLALLIDKGAKFRPRPLTEGLCSEDGPPSRRSSTGRAPDDIKQNPYHPMIAEARYFIEGAIINSSTTYFTALTLSFIN